MASKFEFPRISAAAAGISPTAVVELVRDWEQKGLELHSFMLLRGGRVAAETYWAPYRPGDTHMLNSLSKSFTSTAILFAIQEGLLSPDDKIVSFFPEKAAKLQISEKMERVTLRHLLSMCTGHEPEADFIFARDDCVSAFLASEIKGEPGARFAYNTGATFMLSAALQARTGQTLVEFLRPRLFEPLGMSAKIWSEMTADGICYGGFGLHVTTDDIARLGMLYLNRGVFNGKRILDAALVDEASRRHISNCGSTQTPWLDAPGATDVSDSDIDPTNDWGMGYGWQLWRCVPEGIYRADGAFGQYCIVMPRQDAVLAVTAGSGDMQGILRTVWDKLLPGMSGAVSDNSQAELDALLANRALPAAPGEKTSPSAARVDGAAYKFDYRGAPFIAGFNFEGDVLNISLEVGEKRYKVSAGFGRHIENHLGFTAGRSYNPPFKFILAPDLAASWAWNKNGALVVKCVLTGYAYTETAEITFDGGGASGRVTMNIQVEEPFALLGRRV